MGDIYSGVRCGVDGFNLNTGQGMGWATDVIRFQYLRKLTVHLSRDYQPYW